MSKRLEAIPGVGPLIATALVASIPALPLKMSGAGGEADFPSDHQNWPLMV